MYPLRMLSRISSSDLLLVVLCGVLFLDGLDVSMVGVALPSINADLHLTTSQLQWIVSGYVLGYGGLLLLRRPVPPTCSAGGGRCSSPSASSPSPRPSAVSSTTARCSSSRAS